MQPQHRTKPDRHIAVAVLVSGAATMALQMCAVRLLAPWVGASAFVWATTIGLSLLAMATGYLLGGRLADRNPVPRTLVPTLAIAGIWTAIIPLVAPWLLPHADLGFRDPTTASVAGAAVAYLALFLVPAALLGVTPPVAIRIATRHVEEGGRVAGSLYARSTVGSILGTLLTALVLVQWIGTRASLWGIAGVLIVLAVVLRRIRVATPADPDDMTPRASASTVTTEPLALRLAVVLVAIEGVATMAVEVSTARLVAPFFGASHVVWAILIAVVLGSIALGSRMGGSCADRWPRRRPLALLLASAGAAVALLPIVALPVMRQSTGGIENVAVGTVAGSFLATMALLVIPVLLLGMVPPWVIRLTADDIAHRGRVVGRIYAASTGGAIVGTFGAALWLVPAFGPRRTIVGVGALVLVLALVVGGRRLVRSDTTWWQRGWVVAACVAVVVAAVLPMRIAKPVDGGTVIAERDSRYQFAQVVRDEDDRRLLQLNEGWAVHSITDPETILTDGIWDHFLVLPDLTAKPDDATRMLLIGNAAGTAARAYRALRPDVQIDGVEIDPDVTELGSRYFDMDGDNLRVHEADGRPFLRHAGSKRWDVMHIDAYRQPYIPFYLATREFFDLARTRLAPGGVLSINVGSTPDDPRIVESIAATMRDVFPTVIRYRAERYNELVIAVDDPDVTADELRSRVRASGFANGTAQSDPGEISSRERVRVRDMFEEFADGIRPVRPDDDLVLTDDRADVEWLTDRMVFGEAW